MSDFPKLPRIKADDENMERIHCAARKGQTEEIMRLMEQGIDPTIQNRFGCTALHLACKFGQVETAKYLASVSDPQTSWHGQRPLQLAVLSNNLELVEALVEGARALGKIVDVMLNECDSNEVIAIGKHEKHCKGQTALHWCVGLGDEFLPMLGLLVRLGASPTAKDKNNETPLMRAIEFSNDAAFQLMLENVQPGQLRLDICDRQSQSHLHWAIKFNQEAYALRFHELGHDVNMEDENHVVPLYLALRAAMPTLLKALLPEVDPFSVQQAPFHNGSTVIPDRIPWLPFVDDENARTECVRAFQKRLEEVCVKPDDGKSKRKKKKAPARSQSQQSGAVARSRSRSTQKKHIAAR